MQERHPIRYQFLPKEIKDRLELKELTDQTFYRVLEEDYTEEFMSTLEARKSVEVEHSFLASVSSSQGTGKCVDENELIFVKRNYRSMLVPLKDVVVGDVIWGSKYNKTIGRNLCSFIPKRTKVLNVNKSFESGIRVISEKTLPFVISEKHRQIVVRDGKLVEINGVDLVVGDKLVLFPDRKCMFNGEFDNKKYILGFLAGAYVADGNLAYSLSSRPKVMFTKGDGSVVQKIKEFFKQSFGVDMNECMQKRKNISVSVLYSSDCLAVSFFKQFGDGTENKMLLWDDFDYSFLVGFLRGLVNCDSAINHSKTKHGNHFSQKNELSLMFKSKKLALSVFNVILGFGYKCRIMKRVLKSGDYIGNEYFKLAFSRLDGEKFFGDMGLVGNKKIIFDEICASAKNAEHSEVFGKFLVSKILGLEHIGFISMVDLETESGTFFLANGVLTHNSYLGIFCCGYLDPNFGIDKIYFDYNKLVYDRQNLRSHSAVLVDEQTQSYGLDSHRVITILNALKEQLRKKSIHMFFCAPVLYPEYQTSMYVIEPLFIDYEERSVCAAYKTRELHCLGHIHVPHPEVIVGKQFLKEYEKRKDEHLDALTGRVNVDEIEEFARKVVEHKMFQIAENIYVKNRGYIPQNMLFTLVGKIFPEFKGSVINSEVAARVKFNCEVEGRWFQPKTSK